MKQNEISAKTRHDSLQYLQPHRRLHGLAPQPIRHALEHHRELRTAILDFSHTPLGQRIAPALHHWEMGGGTPTQYARAEKFFDMLMNFVAIGHRVAPRDVRALMHNEMEVAFPDRPKKLHPLHRRNTK